MSDIEPFSQLATGDGAPSADGEASPLAIFRHDRLPRWALVRQRFDAAEIVDIAASVSEAIAGVAHRLPRRGRVCLGLGSRGIDRIDEVARAAVSALHDRGLDVFAVPAMGSHGGATPDGQLAVLASLGITAESIGCPIRSSLETVNLGELDSGVPLYFDRVATEADAVIPVNRVKLHTDFSGPTESGLMKMIAIGFGKQLGADTLHRQGFDRFATLIPNAVALALARVPIPFGLALVENGHARLRHVEAVPSDQLYAREQELLRVADGLMARLPFASADVLVIDRIGKDVSGLGMDSNVVGRYYSGPTGHGPDIQRIIVRDLSDATEGNAVGVGMADVVLRRAVERMDRVKTYVNCITAKTPEGARVGITADTDREALDVAIASCLNVEPHRVRIARIRDTKSLEWLYVSEALLDEVVATGSCEVARSLGPMAFDGAGSLADALPI
jgi:hypothetical protein